MKSGFILGGDIGGTNPKLGIFEIKNGMPSMVQKFDFKTADLSGPEEAINYALDSKKEYIKHIKGACLGVAGGTIGENRVQMTNSSWIVDGSLIEKETGLETILINDFQAVGWGINTLKPKDTRLVKSVERKKQKYPVLVIGAGTGLGKATLYYDQKRKLYEPQHSEAGNTDFPFLEEFSNLVSFVKKSNNLNNVSYEDIVSGRGIIRIYEFIRQSGAFKSTEHTREIDSLKDGGKPELISKYKSIDRTCRETFEFFRNAYAVFARNFAIESETYGGVYIAGGIAPKNPGIFNKEFVRIFMQNDRFSGFLKQVPVYLITNPNAGLMGAGFAGAQLLK